MTIKYFAFDTETTGIAEDAECISLSYQLLGPQFEVVSSGTWYAHPSSPDKMSAEAAKVNGYTYEKWEARGATTQAVFQATFIRFLETSGLNRTKPLGHNVSFDIGKIRSFVPVDLFRRALAYHFADSMVLAIALDDARGVTDARYNLKELCTRYGVSLTDAHDALADITATVELYKVLIGFLGGPQGDKPLPAPKSSFLEKTADGYVYAYGKHKGVLVEDVSPGYRQWVLGNVNLTDEHRAILSALR